MAHWYSFVFSDQTKLICKANRQNEVLPLIPGAFPTGCIDKKRICLHRKDRNTVIVNSVNVLSQLLKEVQIN